MHLVHLYQMLYKMLVIPLCKDRLETPEPLLFYLLWGERQADDPLKYLCPASVSCGRAGNAALGESPTRFGVGFPTPRVDRGPAVGERSVKNGFLTLTPFRSGTGGYRRHWNQSYFLTKCRQALHVTPRLSNLSQPKRT